MRNAIPCTALSALFLASCATTQQSTMSAEELRECLQPNRRVVVEAAGMVVKPPAKKPAAPPAGSEGKPEAKPDAKPEAKADVKPDAKPAKPAMMPFSETAYVQGNSAFDSGNAVLKPEGQKELEQLVATLKKRAVQVNAVIISGHTDRLEAGSGNKGLSETRARAVKDYLVSQGVNEKLIFWEGKDAREPVPVTKFCT